MNPFTKDGSGDIIEENVLEFSGHWLTGTACIKQSGAFNMHIIKQIIAYLVLVFLVVCFSLSGLWKEDLGIWPSSEFLTYAYAFAFANFFTIFIPALLAILYSIALYKIVNRLSKWHLYMAINAIIVIILPIATVIIFSLFNLNFLDRILIITTRQMFIIGLLCIILSFIYKAIHRSVNKYS